MDKNKKVVFTQHSRDRFMECRFKDVGQAVSSFRNSVENKEIKKYKDLTKNKQDKYSSQDEIKYRRNGTIIFTYCERTDKFSHIPAYVVITMTNQLASSGVKI